MNPFFQRRSDDLLLALYVLQIIRFLRLPGALDNIRALTEQTIGMGANITFVPVTSTMMAYVRIYWQGTCLICMDGATRLQQYQSLAASYASPGSDRRYGYASDYLMQLASVVLADAVGSTYLPAPRVILAGQSLGGAVMVALGAGIKSQYDDLSISVLTFGSPRSGGYELARTYSVIDITRYMNNDDPVPLIPPRGNTSRISLATVPPSALLQWNRMDHTRGGVLLFEDGSTVPADLPSDDLVPFDKDIVSWLASMVQGESNPHSVPTYAWRIRAAMALNPQAPRPVVTEPDPEPRNHTTGREMAAMIQEVTKPIRAQGDVQAGTPVHIPREKAFRPVKRGSVWVCLFNERVVGIGPKERRARSMARNGNRLLRAMQPMSVVEVDAMLGAWDQYFGAASDPTKGFEPVMETKIG